MTYQGRKLNDVVEENEFFFITLELSDTTSQLLYEEDKEIEIYWNITSTDQSYFKVETSFNNPELVSTDGLDPDKIGFQLLNPQAFIGILSR